MKRSIRFFSMILTAFMLLGSMVIPSAAADDTYYHGDVVQKTVWTAASDNGKYTLHRIPGMVVTKKGTVIIYCEARDTRVKGTQGLGGDWCLMDLYLQRSEDRGETFGEPIYICRGSKDTYATINNPVMIVGDDNVLHLLFCKDYSLDGGGLWYTRSTDDGKSWSEPRQLTNYADNITHDCFAFGPTHGICTSEGILMAPAWYVPKGTGRDGLKTSHGPSKAAIMYSTDNGDTWKLADSKDQILSVGNEKNIVELSDGSIMLNGRASPNRHVAVAGEPLGKWDYTGYDQTLIDPGCCGGMAVADVEGLPRALIYGGCASTTTRENVTLYCSFNDGWTWEGRSLALSGAGEGGYVEVYVDNADGKIYCLYEVNGGKEVRLASVSYYDEFCSSATSVGKYKETVFSDKYSIDAVNAAKTRNINYSFTGSALRLETEASSASKRTQLDMSFIAKDVNIQEYPYMLLRIRADQASDADVKLSTYFLGWLNQTATDECLIEQTIPKDGQWYNLVLDTSKMGLKGIIHALELRLAGADGSKTANVAVEIESMAFTKTLEEAQAYVFGRNEVEEPVPDDGKQDNVPDAQATEPQEDEDGKDEKKGCGSSIAAGTALLGIVGTGTVVLSRKKNTHNRKERKK